VAINLPVSETLNVVVADNQPIFIEGLKSVMKAHEDALEVRLKGVAHNGDEISNLLRSGRVDILMLDLNLPEPDSLKLIPVLKERFPELRILVMTMHDDPRLVKAAFRGGADGYLLKNGDPEELFQAMHEVVEGNTFLGKGVAVSDRLPGSSAGANMPEDRFVRRYGLTRREMEVMKYIGQAFSNKDIAEQLFISDQTVSVHRKNIMRKIGVKSTANLIRIAYENNLV
jgi:DNA-binding NarL/FixJ family response regulator